MSSTSNNNGRAFEYCCIHALCDLIRAYRPVQMIQNSSYYAAEHAWKAIDINTQLALEKSAVAAAETILELEPLITEDGTDVLELMIQKDNAGQDGDVRDILLIRRNIQWEIGLSMKHNHFAVKHSRLAKNLDFGQQWFGTPCSDQYWNDIRPIFDMLQIEKQHQTRWNQLPDKEGEVYIPLLRAFVDEVKRATARDSVIPEKMVEYLLGRYDFYKVISMDSRRKAEILTFNMRGSLNQPSRRSRAKIIVPVSTLPSRIVWMDFAPGSHTTVELYMNEGWQFSFRIHNASTFVEPSLKFDIQIIGMPTTILTIDCDWR